MHLGTSPGTEFEIIGELVKRVDEAVTSHFPLLRGVDLRCQSVLRHETPKVDLYGLVNLDHGGDLKDEARACVNEGRSTS